MRSLIPVAVNNNRALAYRTIEIEEAMKKNMLAALAISILIHALIVASYFLFPAPPIDMTGVKFDTKKIPWVPRSIAFENYEVRRGLSGAAPAPSGVKSGKIVVVPDGVAPPNITFAKQDEMMKVGSTQSGDGTEGNGPIVTGGPGEEIDSEIVEPEPPVFVAVERQPVLVRCAMPHYPELMVKSGIEGKVWVKIWVDKLGKVRDVRILKSDNEMFNEAALEAAKGFLFTPAYMNNGPVSVWVSVPFSFKLH